MKARQGTGMSLKLRRFLGVDGRSRGLVVVAASVPFALLIAYLFQGAEQPRVSLSFSILFMVLALFSMAMTKARFVTPGMLIAIAAIAAWAVSGGFGSWHQARIEVLVLCGAAGIWMVGHTLGRSGGLLVLAWRFTIWVILVFAVIAIAMQLLRYTADPLDVLPVDKHRLRGTLDHANTAATLFAMGAILAAGQILYIADHPGREEITRHDIIDGLFIRALSSIILLTAALACLVLTASRAGLVLGVAMLGALIGWEYLVYRRRQARRPSRTTRRLKWLLLISVPVIALVAVAGELMLVRRAADLGDDAMSRFGLYEIYWQAWQEQPLFGHGLGSFDRVNDQIATLENAHMVTLLGEAHNFALQWLIQQGLLGLGLMMAIMIAIHVPLVRYVFSSGARSRTYLRTALCISGLVFLHGMVDYAVEVPGVMWTYAWLIGLAHGRASALSHAPVLAPTGTEAATGEGPEAETVGGAVVAS